MLRLETLLSGALVLTVCYGNTVCVFLMNLLKQDKNIYFFFQVMKILPKCSTSGYIKERQSGASVAISFNWRKLLLLISPSIPGKKIAPSGKETFNFLFSPRIYTFGRIKGFEYLFCFRGKMICVGSYRGVQDYSQ